MVLFWIPFLVVFLDRLTKLLVVGCMTEGESIPVIEDFFHWTYVLNPGAAFGMLPHSRLFFLAAGAAAVIGVILFRREILAGDWRVRIGAGFFLGGALGNLWDRWQTGLVIDFFDFRVWPVFNIADIAICTGVGLILWSMLAGELTAKGKEK